MDSDTTNPDWFPTLLGATLMGVYLLVVSGTTTAVANGEAACHGWPACDGHLLVPPTRLALAVGWAHRAAVSSLGWLYVGTTLVFGGVFVWSVLRLHRDRTDRAAIRSFHASNAYLGALLVAVAASPLL